MRESGGMKPTGTHLISLLVCLRRGSEQRQDVAGPRKPLVLTTSCSWCTTVQPCSSFASLHHRQRSLDPVGSGSGPAPGSGYGWRPPLR